MTRCLLHGVRAQVGVGTAGPCSAALCEADLVCAAPDRDRGEPWWRAGGKAGPQLCVGVEECVPLGLLEEVMPRGLRLTQ